MANTGTWLYVVLFLLLPALFLVLQALVLSFHFWLTILALTLFALGVVLGAGALEEKEGS